MIDINNIYVLLGAFIPFFASFIWVLILLMSLYDIKTRQEQQTKIVSLLFFTTFAVGCLLPIHAPYNDSGATFLTVCMPIVTHHGARTRVESEPHLPPHLYQYGVQNELFILY